MELEQLETVNDDELDQVSGGVGELFTALVAGAVFSGFVGLNLGIGLAIGEALFGGGHKKS